MYMLKPNMCYDGYIFSLNVLLFKLCIINPLSAELNPICPLLVLFRAQHILHISK